MFKIFKYDRSKLSHKSFAPLFSFDKNRSTISYMKNVAESSNEVDKSPFKTSTRVLETEKIDPISQVNFWWVEGLRGFVKSPVLECSVQKKEVKPSSLKIDAIDGGAKALRLAEREITFPSKLPSICNDTSSIENQQRQNIIPKRFDSYFDPPADAIESELLDFEKNLDPDHKVDVAEKSSSEEGKSSDIDK